MRSVAAAVNLFVTNIVGLGLGPLSVGIISDWLALGYGIDSVRYGLLAMVGVLFISAVAYFRAGVLLARQSSG